jgi:hypothetical protein
VFIGRENAICRLNKSLRGADMATQIVSYKNQIVEDIEHCNSILIIQNAAQFNIAIHITL